MNRVETFGDYGVKTIQNNLEYTSWYVCDLRLRSCGEFGVSTCHLSHWSVCVFICICSPLVYLMKGATAHGWELDDIIFVCVCV